MAIAGFCRYQGAMLNLLTYGEPSALPPLLIVHGLFGSARNWGVIARRLADSRQIFAVDMRNHGESPHLHSQSYPDMADDLINVLARIGRPCDLMGHSMGGKAAMLAALSDPDAVRRLIVADIAPVAYAHTQMHNIDAMRGVDLARVSRRSEAADQLIPLVDNPALVPFFLQSLDTRETPPRWRLNLDVLAAEMDKIIGFPPVTGQYPNPTLFLTGAGSDYVKPEHRDKIKSHFPIARFAKIPGAGHWLHADKPREFEAAVRVFLDAADR